ncbi:MAG: diguanylate cyclase [Gemmatimonadota bacterium]
MTAIWHFPRPAIPRRAIILCLAALAVPVAYSLFRSGPSSQAEPLLWLLALVPAFLLSYYRGWRGAATALALGMVLLTITQFIVVFRGGQPASWSLLFFTTTALLAIGLALGWTSELLHGQRAEAERMALTDDLTGIWNRRRVRMFLDTQFERAQAGVEENLSVVLFDLDRFKSFNDLHGHKMGDEALRNFAQTLLRTTRGPDLSARYGGEEFLTVLCSCDEQGALSFVQRVRTELQRSQREPPYLTTCAGIACFRAAMSSPNDLLIAADSALYAAKAAGQDMVRLHSTEPVLRSG